MIAPFFVTYLIRTLAWETILADQGLVVALPARRSHVLGDDGRLLATSTAVVAGHHLQLPAVHGAAALRRLEQIDPRLIEAAHDLYASRSRSFLRVTLPLSLPGRRSPARC